jgi:hypothetical protein
MMDDKNSFPHAFELRVSSFIRDSLFVIRHHV